MDDYHARILIPMTLRFYDRVVEKCKFKRNSEMMIMFRWIRVQLPICCMMIDGQRMMMYAQEHACEAQDEGDFREMVRKVWAAARVVEGQTRHRLIVFFIGVGSLCGRLSMAADAPEAAKQWIQTLEDAIAGFLSPATNPEEAEAAAEAAANGTSVPEENAGQNPG